VIGLYCNQKSAIRVAMRKVYQMMNVNSKKLENEWTWLDEYSCISIMELPIIDAKDIKGDSPLPQYFRYREFLKDVPKEDLERFRIQALNRKKILEKLHFIKRN
jgi:hypothetical protein